MSYRGYIPNITAPFQHVLPTRPPELPVIFGSVDPEGAVIGAPGQYYVNTETTRMWVKIAGVQQHGWREVGVWVGVGGGGGGGGSVFAGSYDNPNGYITATAPAIYYSFNGGVWVKTTTELNNEGWQQIIV